MRAWQKALGMAAGVGTIVVPIGSAGATAVWINNNRAHWFSCMRAASLEIVQCTSAMAMSTCAGALFTYDTRRLLQTVRGTSQWRVIVRESAFYTARNTMVVGCGVVGFVIAGDAAKSVKKTWHATV